jgi:hypothetical protein
MSGRWVVGCAPRGRAIDVKVSRRRDAATIGCRGLGGRALVEGVVMAAAGEPVAVPYRASPMASARESLPTSSGWSWRTCSSTATCGALRWLVGAAEAFRFSQSADEVDTRLDEAFFNPARERHGPYGHVIDELDDAPRLGAEDAIRAARERLCVPGVSERAAGG